jgi:hypothetical protein
MQIIILIAQNRKCVADLCMFCADLAIDGFEEKKEEEKGLELEVLIRAIDVEFALAMHEGQKLGENRDRIIGLRFDERDDKLLVVILFLSTDVSEAEAYGKGTPCRAMCLAEVGPVLHHRDPGTET